MSIPQRAIDVLLQGLEEGRQAWISGQFEWTAASPVQQDPEMTIAGPFGGPPIVADPARQAQVAAAWFHGGTGRNEVVKVIAGDDLVVVIMIERNEVKFEGRSDRSPWILRTTQVFRRVGDGWVRLHRHADPLINRRGLEETLSLLEG